MAAALSVIACSDKVGLPTAGVAVDDGGPVCDFDDSLVMSGGVGRDGIPSLQDPAFLPADADDNGYLRRHSRVIGLVANGQAYAVPHNILWWHEVVNLTLPVGAVAVTYCPLTGSSLAFDRSAIDGQELGVSGLLFMNNLIMFNRGEPGSLWPQMQGRARCEPRTGETLAQYPIIEMTWSGWRQLHPDTKVISPHNEHDRDYGRYPYGDYEAYSDGSFPFPTAMPPLDTRRPVKERVLGVPPTRGASDAPDPGIAFPFDALDSLDGDIAAVEFDYAGEPGIVLWSDIARGGMAYRPTTRDGRTVTLEVRDERFVDRETGSVWMVDGRATDGELAESELVEIQRAHVAFWGAWAAFHPDTRLWDGD